MLLPGICVGSLAEPVMPIVKTRTYWKTDAERARIAERIGQLTVRAGECLIWTGAKDRRGTGLMQIGGGGAATWRLARVPRVVMALAGRPLGEGMCACHRCDNPSCCEETHLFAGTYTDNMRDCIAKGRFQPLPVLHGSSHHRSKLTEESVRAIRQERILSASTLATTYGVSAGRIRAIRRGKGWVHVSDGAV